jgi:drug/metabolite transporter (DMT)-like permease
VSALALALVVGSAFFHATWNMYAKESEDKLLFLWWMLGAGALVFLPILIFGPWPSLPHEGWNYILASGAIHAFYYIFLAQAYERGDLSVVYPLARGSGALLVVVLAALIIGERLSSVGLVGIGSIVLGLLLLHRSPGEGLTLLRGAHVPRALCTGATIASYSIVDKLGVAVVHPLPFVVYFHLTSFVLLAPWILVSRGRGALGDLRRYRGRVVMAGGFQNLAYGLVLAAMTLANVSYVVAAREVNVIFGAILGTWRLGEGRARQKLTASVLIAAGLILIGRFG